MRKIPSPEEFLLPGRLERFDEVLSRRLVSLTVVLERLHKGGNLSAILRTCDALGIQDVHMVSEPEQEDIASAVTRGCEKWLTLRLHPAVESCYADLRGEGFRILAGSLGPGARPLEETDLSGKVALVFGNEKAGVTAEAARRADGLFVIPMAGFSRSFNVSVAAGIALYRARRWKENGEGITGDVPPERKAALRDLWARVSRRRVYPKPKDGKR